MSNTRISKSDLDNEFELFCDNRKQIVGGGVGEHFLDSDILGYCVKENLENGCRTSPLGMRRRSLREMYNVLEFYNEVCEQDRVKEYVDTADTE